MQNAQVMLIYLRTSEYWFIINQSGLSIAYCSYFVNLMELMLGIFYLVTIVFSAIIHEYSHGWMAEQLGDPTARYAGRLTLDPRAHIDLWGTILLPLLLFFGTGGRFVFGYAKPVPFNPYNLSNQRWGPALVGLAGPLSNLLLATSFALLYRVLPTSGITPFIEIIVLANILLMVFNMVPIPPLDGSKVLFALLPDSMYRLKGMLEQYGLMVLLIFIFFFAQILSPIIFFIHRILLGL